MRPSRILLAATLLAVTALLATACAGALQDLQPLEYSFDHPLFNEPWGASAAVVTARPAKARPAAVAERPKPADARGALSAAAAPAEPDAAPAEPAGPPELPPAMISGTHAGVAAPAPIDAPGERHADRRAETLEAARRLLGMRDAFDGRGFLHHLLTAGDVRLSGIGGTPELRDVYRALRAQSLTYDGSTPQPGDLVFFHNTEDENGDGRQNDWYSLVGVVEAIDEDGTVSFIVPIEGEVTRRVLNLDRPEVRRLEASGAVLNDVLRTKRLDDPPQTQYLSGELFAGFAALPE